ncbi:MAG TPA: citrate synthase [Polyangiaceae bacterium LLY-WYZ-15_(1-7)]|nr:citrate synthase [Polyangiaceae bacterium LLY-WYZ-15_(1-7)]HJL02896.1 citrate synthase [Polyangiaceae bacterium LLY-WYZ-15_(1-7)]HJL07498.1 citrate synthase [Polyangiaceae bacterium LLY-WYZ-15_(1-7)]HJL20614.1 citrate synthase [Polyangiaceae bacterium LLY-WYZ-15_(1-7)]HJL33195.1 citrate synthase [Polyangiaceae bacterium LLY-WYZ-15_(1-7)]
MADKPDYVPGLAGVPAARSSVCLIDGQVGKLQYRGYPIEQLAESCSYEEVVYLLLFGELPTKAQLESFDAELKEERGLKFRIVDVLKNLPERGHPMDALTAAVACMGMFYPGDHVEDLEFRRLCAIRLVAKLPTVVAAWHRIRRGDNPIEPRTDLGHAANFLYMLEGHEPDELEAKVMDVALILHAEHSMNASTFTARVTGSTLSDPYAAVASAIGSLAGPLHGGANERVLEMLRTIEDSTSEAVRRWAEDKLARKEKIMGFGHRVYKVKDPRANILQKLATQLFEKRGRTPIYDIAVELEKQMGELVGHKGIAPNVDFYSGIVYEKMGIPVDLFTPVFAIARVGGWLAHLLEQLQDNRIFRPTQIWIGEADRTVPPLADRG